MPIASGTRLGTYEITGYIGSGGMAEVYRARDGKLNRDVAIKVLPELFAADPDRLARFEREAQTLASLNHPAIAQIHGVVDQPPGLVMEHVDGEDLAQRIARGPLSLDETISIVRQIIDALEAAHGRGIVHRDLKPANVKVRPDGAVKVLDFGLAKAMADEPANLANVANSPTFTSPVAMTALGVILGTAAYMSPEQARGRVVDQRTDIWAFGCVLFEMLAGRAAFTGDTVTEVLAKVIERDPDWAALPPTTPIALRRLLRRCLDKNPRRRLAAIADARFELDEITSAAPEAVSPAGRPARLPLAIIGILSLAVAASTYGWIRAARSATASAVAGTYVAATLAVNLPDLATLTDRFAVSPDGTLLALVDGVHGGLLLRRTSSLEVTPVAGTPPDAYSPVFSPDGKWIAFRTDSALMKIPTEGGKPTVLVHGSDYFTNLTWGVDDRIRFPSLHNDAIRTISADGGAVETMPFGPHAWVSRAVWLPNGRLLVSLMTEGESRIVVREPDGALRKLLDGWDARLTPAGQLLFSRQEGTTWSVVAAPFDVNAARVTGDAAVLAQDVPVRYATPAAADAAGDLFYIAGTPRSDRRVVMVDRAGAARDLPAQPGAWVEHVLSPDGQRLALNRFEGARRTLWTLTLDTGALTQVTYSDDTFGAQWTPDGRRLVFSYFPIDPALRATSLWSVLTDGRGSVQPIAAQWDAYTGAVSSDGRVLYYSAYQARQDQEDIVSVALDGATPKPTVVLATPASERAATPSPDGRLLAYETNASGVAETRVALLADLTASVQLSTRGGTPIRWSPDSRKLYYVDGPTISSVDVGPTGPVLASRRAIFSIPADWRGRVDVTPDGDHAVMIRGGLIYSDIVVLQGALRAAHR